MRREDLLDLNEVLQHPGKKLSWDISTELEREEDVDLLSSVEGWLEALSTGNQLLITGKFRANTEMECARCGGPLPQAVEVEIEEQFPVEGVASSYGTGDYARVVADEPVPLFDGNHLIVDALLREALLLSLPMQPLCEYGWDGPCPVAEERKIQLSAPGDHLHDLARLRNLLNRDGDASKN